MSITKNYTVDYWRDLFASQSDLPWARVAAWMQVESNGAPQAIGTIYEVGIIQIDLQDGPKYGGTVDNLCRDFATVAIGADGKYHSTRTRDLTPDEEQLQVAVADAYISALLATSHGQVDALGWSDDDLWCLVKLHHALPALASQAFTYAKAQDQVSDWDTFRSFTEGLPAETFPGWGPRYTPWSRFFNNAEKVGKLGLSSAVGAVTLPVMIALAVAAWFLWRFA